MVCKSFIKFSTQDKENIFKSARCLFAHQKMENMTHADIGPQREKLLDDLDKCARIATDMIDHDNHGKS